MKTNLNLNGIISILLICFATTVFSQDVKKKSVGDVVYEEYQKSDVDKALAKYRDLKAKRSADYNFTEWELNRIGYLIMRDGDLEAAEKVFRLNMEEYPQAANPQDSYADYLMEKGDKKAARKYYEKSVSMAEKSTREDEKDLLRASKAKLAKLDNKHKQLDFLIGNWDVKSTSFTEGLGSGAFDGSDEYIRDNDENIMMINHMDDRGQVVGKRILVYNAMDDVYDAAYINILAPMGMETSTLKLKDLGNDTFELVEKSNNKDRADKKMKHELKKRADGGMDWVIYESDAGKEDWKKVYAMEMRKNK